MSGRKRQLSEPAIAFEAASTDQIELSHNMFPVTTSVPRDLWMKTQYILNAADRTIYRTARPTMVAFEGTSEQPFVNEDADEVLLVNEQVELLKRLYVTFPPDVQAMFTMTMLGQLTKANAPVVAQTIIELHELHRVTEWTALMK